MNHTPDPDLRSILAAPGAPRAVLVRLECDALQVTPVAASCSVVDLETDLTDHLSAEPRSDALLIDLRDYCQARLDARAAARTSGGLAVAGAGRTWNVIPMPGLQRLEIH